MKKTDFFKVKKNGIKSMFVFLLLMGSCAVDNEPIEQEVVNDSTDELLTITGSSSLSANSTKISVTATASATQSSTYAASKAVDGSLSTRWTASGTVYLYLDLGTAQLIDYVKMAHHNGSSRKYNMQFYTNSSKTITGATLIGTKTSGFSDALQTYDLTNSTARYLIVKCTGNTQNTYSDVEEIEVWGTASTSTGSSNPTSVLGITASKWKINSHTGSPSNSTYWDDITDSGANYSTYSDSNYFYSDGTWTYFKCWRGAGTSSTSQNPRVELREMNGTNTNASWNGSSGTHTMTWTVRVDRLPKGSNGTTGVLCFGQIHGPSTNSNGVEVDDVIRVQFEGTANQTSGTVKLKISGYVTETIGGSSITKTGYSLGTSYTFSLKYTGGKVYLYNGSTLVFSQQMDTSTEGNYFKVGNYLQSVKGSSYDGSHGIVAVKGLSISH